METIAFSHAASSTLLKKVTTNMEQLSSFSTGAVYGWITAGDHLEIFNKNNGNRVSSVIFGSHGKSKHNTLITAVCECSSSSMFAVATVTDDPNIPGSLLCLVNARTSAIEKAIAVPYEVTSMEYLGESYISSIDLSNLNKRFKYFDGTIVLGTYNGHTYLLDLKLNQQSQTTEKSPGKIITDQHITGLLSNDHHMAVWLGEDSKSEKNKRSGLHISSLRYMKKTSLLAVGFSDGLLELWDLRLLMPVFSNFIAEQRKGILISHFAFQEPENDPKNVCYLWVFYSPSQGNPRSVGQAFLLQMVFQDRSFEEEVGYVYRGFLNAFLRFSHQLCSNLNSHFMAPTKLLSCSCLSSGLNEEEGCYDEEDMMVVVWQETKEKRDPQLYLLAFDLNQWYHCQMPSSLDSENFMSSSDFIIVHSLTELEKQNNVLCVKVEVRASRKNEDSTSILPFLDFDMTAITLTGLVFGNILNYNMQINNEVERCQKVLFDRDSYYEICYKLREFCKDNLISPSFTETNEHFALLSVILDSGSTGALVSIVRQLACARLTGVESFLTLEHVVEWSREKLLSIKLAFNRLVVPLLQLGPAQCDNRSSKSYNKCKDSIHWLLTVLFELTDVASDLAEKDQQQLLSCVSLAMHIEKYISASYWFLNSDSLCFCHGVWNGGKISKQLVEDYQSRRIQLQGRKLSIDFMVSLGGSSVKNHFTTFSQTSSYPPLNLETLLGLYLLPDVCLQSKYFISMYLLEDLLVGASEEKRLKMLTAFASQMNISKSFAQLVRASWLLDHQRLKESYKILHYLPRDNKVDSQFYVNMVKTFLAGNEINIAIRVSTKFLMPVMGKNEICTLMEAMAAKGKINDAYQSSTRVTAKSSEYFAEVMNKCGKGGFLREMLKSPMVSNGKGCTYCGAFKSFVKTSISEELFNKATMKVKNLKRYLSEKKSFQKKKKNGQEGKMLSNCLNKGRSKEDTSWTLENFLHVQTEATTEDETTAEEIFLLPKSFEPQDMIFLEIPMPNKFPSPMTTNICYPSILSKPRSTSSQSGDSVSTSKQLRFADPEQNTCHFINDETQHRTPKEIFKEIYTCPTIAEEPENDSIQSSEIFSQNELNSNATESQSSGTTENTLDESFAEAEETHEPLTCRNETLKQTACEISATENEKAEGSLPTDKRNEAVDVNLASFCTNEISEHESCHSEVSEESLRRPPLKRTRRSQGNIPSTPPRRSSRLSSLVSTHQEEKQVKRIKVEDSNLDTSFFPSQKLKKSGVMEIARESIDNQEELVKTPNKALTGARRSSRVAKRPIDDDIEEQEINYAKDIVSEPVDNPEDLVKTPNKTSTSAHKSSRVVKRPRDDDDVEGQEINDTKEIVSELIDNPEDLVKTPNKSSTSAHKSSRVVKRPRDDDVEEQGINDTKEIVGELIDNPEDLVKTPSKTSTGARKSSRVAKRHRDEGDVEEQAGKKRNIEGTLTKTPVKNLSVNTADIKTSRSTQKLSTVNEEEFLEKICNSPTRARSKKEVSSLEIEKDLQDEGPLTPAQRIIRMKRLLREESDKVSNFVKPFDQTSEAGEKGTESSIRDNLDDESTTKTSFVFSPPLTRQRQRRKEESSRGGRI